ncbi:MAG: lysostaphin resistance A-like protein [Planctomycetota bacterium]
MSDGHDTHYEDQVPSADQTPMHEADPVMQAGPVALPVARPLRFAGHPIHLWSSSRASCAIDLAMFVVLVMLLVFFVPDVIAISLTGIPAERFAESVPESAPVTKAVGDEAGDVHSAFLLDPLALTQVWIIPITLMRCIATIVVILLMLYYRSQGFSSVGIARRGLGVDVLLGVLMAAICLCLMVLYSISLHIFAPELRPQMEKNAVQLLKLFPPSSLDMLAILAIAVGTFEELIFRGFLMTRLRRVTGNWAVAVVISTLIFTIPHVLDQTLVALGPIALLAVSLSICTILRKSLIPAILGHALFDFVQFVYLFYPVAQ